MSLGSGRVRPSRMISPSSPWPRGASPIAATFLGRDPARDEALDPAACVGDAERRVPRPDELADAIDDELEDAVDVQLRGDGAGGRLERRQPLRPPVDLRPRPDRIHRQLEGPGDLLAGTVGRVQEQPSQRPPALLGDKLEARRAGERSPA